MKMKHEHYKTIKEHVDNFITDNRTDLFAHIAFLLKNDRYLKGSGDIRKRLRWDIFTCTGLNDGSRPVNYITGVLYPYLNDNHIDSALRSIMKEHGFYNEL